jgi:hypothetical protein
MHSNVYWCSRHNTSHDCTDSGNDCQWLVPTPQGIVCMISGLFKGGILVNSDSNVTNDAWNSAVSFSTTSAMLEYAGHGPVVGHHGRSTSLGTRQTNKIYSGRGTRQYTNSNLPVVDDNDHEKQQPSPQRRQRRGRPPKVTIIN